VKKIWDIDLRERDNIVRVNILSDYSSCLYFINDVHRRCDRKSEFSKQHKIFQRKKYTIKYQTTQTLPSYFYTKH